ncbi:hypothetical protein [Blastococcus saxobsidens]|uniref:Uncharacterized protein n=1 Tax=Blastococcus saxobsidens TaxID=138336 RepID=A0A4Q7Y5K2_9ACTN|nr:hypothetical protein [Blastococcus saxobsidens]RZU31169.1 hypothetical protein BKA19_0818 [Blastococcus saxobsidens]
MAKREEFDYFVSGGVELFSALAEDTAAEQWHQVSGGSLGERRVLVRLAKDDRGALSCTGLVVGLDGEEVTSTNLRSVPVTAIVRDIGRRLSAEPAGDVDRLLQEILGAALAPSPPRRPDHRRRGGRGPTEQDLRDFMRALHLAGGQEKRGAMTRAAKQYGIDRATAYRWLPVATQRGITGQECDR